MTIKHSKFLRRGKNTDAGMCGAKVTHLETGVSVEYDESVFALINDAAALELLADKLGKLVVEHRPNVDCEKED